MIFTGGMLIVAY